MAVHFTASPLTLVLLAAAFAGACFYFWWVDRRTITDMSKPRRRLALALRLVIVAALFLSLAGLRLSRTGNSLAVIFLVDASLSVRDDQRREAERYIREAAATRRPDDTVGVVTYAQDPDLKVQPEPASKPGARSASPAGSDVLKASEELKHRGTRTATDIAQAMEFSLPFIPRGSAGKIVVLSDGNENVNSALAAVPSLTARGVKVDTVLLPSTLRREALIEKLVIPPRVKIGEPFTVKVITNALNAQSGTLSLRRNGEPVGRSRDVEIPAGKRTFTFDVSVDKPGVYRYDADLETRQDADTIVENNKGQGFVSVRGKPQVLYVSSTPSLVPYLRQGLRDQHIDVAYVKPEALPTTAAAFQQFDSVILSDVPRADLSMAQMTALQISTRDFGVGFGMIGGAQSFGAGGFRNTPVEETLPVSLEIKKQKRYASVGMALVIDRSGSMQEGGATGARKLDYAKEAAARSVEFLKSVDQVAIVTFTEQADVLLPLTYAGEQAKIQEAISRIETGGGTSVYAGVDAGYRAVRPAATSVRHMIVLTDGMSSDPDYTPLIRAMQREGITVSAILVGAGTGAVQGHHLYRVSKATGGRFYQVDSPQDVPRIYLQEVQTISAPPVVEEPFVPTQTPGDEVLQGIGAMPQLLGYNITTPKPAAGTSLLSHRKDPVLSTWRYGLGRSMAFMSDDRNKWAVHWLPWAGYGKFWAQAIRWTMRSFTPSDFQTDVVMEGTRGHITVSAIDKDGKFVNRLSFNAKVVGPDADSTKPLPDLPLRQTGPGTYEAWFDASRIGTYLVNVTRDVPGKPAEMTISGLVVPYSPEYRDLGANDFLLTQLAQAGGGTFEASPAQAFGGNRPTARTDFDLVPYLLFLAMLLFPFDVAVRRLAIGMEDVRRAKDWAAGRSKRRTARDGRQPAATPELGRLMNARERAATVSPARGERTEPANPAPSRPSEVVTQPPATAADGSRPIQPPTPTASPAADGRSTVQPSAPGSAPVPTEDLSGFERLKAAKQRAREQREKEADPHP